MPDFYSEEQTLITVHRLTRKRLSSFVAADAVRPARAADGGVVYSRVDIARLELLCDLTEGFDLEGDALGLVVTLVDQLHGVRADLAALVEAIAEEGPETRRRLAIAIKKG